VETIGGNKNECRDLPKLLKEESQRGLKGDVVLADGLYARFPKPAHVIGLHASATLPAGTLGISDADEMAAEQVHWIKADNDRKQGWHQVHTRLSTDDEGKPGLYIFKSCKHLWRTLPLLQEHPGDPDDIIHKNAEDHLPDALRYGCMHRPIKPKVRVAPDIGSFRRERQKYLKAKSLAAKRGISISEAYKTR